MRRSVGNSDLVQAGRVEQARAAARDLVDHLNVFTGHTAGYVTGIKMIDLELWDSEPVQRAPRRRLRKDEVDEMRSDRRRAAAWSEVASMLLDRASPDRMSVAGIRLFNQRIAGPHGAPWRVLLGEPDMIPVVGFRDRGADAYYTLLKAIEGRTLDRVKHCPQCGRWFFDETRNKSAERCSTACTEKWWNRSKRKAAAHAQYRERRSR